MSIETFLKAELEEVRKENRVLRLAVRVHMEFETQLRNEVIRLRQILDGVPAPLPYEAWNHEGTDASTVAWLVAYDKWYRLRPRPTTTSSKTADGTGRKAGW